MVQDNANGQKSLLRSIDVITIVIYLLLIAAGWISVVGASYNYGDTDFLDFAARSGKQLTWIVCSFVLGLVIMLTDDRIYDTFANVIYVVMMGILLITPFIATGTKGSYSWIHLGPVSIQPAEFAKCATALALAKYMGSYGFNLSNPRHFIKAVAIVVLPILLIILQRETGSALVYLAFFLVFYREGMTGSVLFIGVAVIVYFVVGLRFDAEAMPHTLTSVGRFTVLLLIWLFTAVLVFRYSRNRKELKWIVGIGVLFGHIFQLRLRAVEKTFAVESAGTDGYFALAHVVAGTVYILFQSQKDTHAFLLVGLKHVVEHVIGGIVGEERAEGEHGDKGQPRKALAQAFDDQIDHDAHTESQLHPGNVERLNIA